MKARPTVSELVLSSVCDRKLSLDLVGGLTSRTITKRCTRPSWSPSGGCSRNYTTRAWSTKASRLEYFLFYLLERLPLGVFFYSDNDPDPTGWV